jgi:hypothetical protein
MASYYIYLVSSLPYLQFGLPAPMEYSRFLGACRDFIPESETAILEKCPDIFNETGGFGQVKKNIVKEWYGFEYMLRNDLVAMRAKRLHKNPTPYFRGFPEGASLEHRLTEILRQPHLLDVEKQLDMLRWQKLDELLFGHYFDFEFLFIYAQKLLILKRWDAIKTASGRVLFDGALKAIEPLNA